MANCQTERSRLEKQLGKIEYLTFHNAKLYLCGHLSKKRMTTTFYKASYRNLLRNKVFSLINISDLAIGIAACFFIFQYAHFERSYEKYNANANNIYRVPLHYHTNSGDDYIEATNYPAVGPALKANFPEVKYFARLIPSANTSGTTTISRIEGGLINFPVMKRGFFLRMPPY